MLLIIYDDFLLEIAQSQVGGVWLFGKIVSAVGCLGAFFWLITEIVKRTRPRFPAVSAEKREWDG